MAETVREAQDVLDKSEFIRHLGIEILEIESSRSRGRMPFAGRYCNPNGSMHGGCIYSLADTIAGILACNDGCDVVTVEGGLHFLEAVWDTSYVYCEANVKKAGNHLITVDVDITDDNGKLLGCGTSTFMKIQG